MAQHDFTIDNQTFPATRSDINSALQALASLSSGASSPSTTFAYQLWVDTTADPNILNIRNSANNAWIEIGEVNQGSAAFILTAYAILQSGSAAAPSHSFDVDRDTGMYRAAANIIGFATNGTERVRINDSGQTELSSGTAALPSITTIGDVNTGIFFPAADTIAFTEGGAEAMRITSTGNVGIGSTSLAQINLRVSKAITGATSAFNVYADGAIQSDVTSVGAYYVTSASMPSGTLSNLFHFYANQVAIGATVTAQVGFTSSSGLIGATNNYGFDAANTAAVTAGKTAYGFHSAINTATGGGTTYGFYAAGTAPNHFVGDLLFNNGYGSAAVAYGCRAWINFNGTGTIAIRASGNVSSIADNGVGSYTINFTTAMPDANYAVTHALRVSSSATATETTGERTYVTFSSYATSSVRMIAQDIGSTSGRDVLYGHVMIAR